MALQLSTAREAEIESMASITYAAFHTSDPANMSSRFFPHNTAEEIHSWRVKKLTASFRDKHSRYVKVTDSTDGRIVSYARWGLPRHPPATTEASNKELAQVDEAALPDGANARLMKAFDSAMHENREKYMDKERDYSENQMEPKGLLTHQAKSGAVLRAIATHPDYQHRGCASMLIQWGLGLADRENARVYLEATPAGKGLYRRFGWEQIDEIVIHLEEYGEEGVQVTAVMMRPASRKTIE